MVGRIGLMRVLLSLCCLAVLPALLHCGTKECYYDTDCTNGRVCKDNTCQDNTVPLCSKDSDCSQGRKCITQRCVLVPPNYEFPSRAEPTKDSDSNPEPVADSAEPSVTDTKDGGNPEPSDGENPETSEPNPETPSVVKCTRGDDCKDKEVCALGGKDGKELVCQPAKEQGLPLGSACDPTVEPSPCVSLLCHPDNKVCSIPCTKDNDCPSGKDSCKEVTFGNGTQVKACAANDKQRQCLRNAHCSQNTVCRMQLNTDKKVSLSCGQPRGSTDAGKICIDNSECKTDICLNQEVCSAPCVEDSDCPQDFECASVSVAYPDPKGATSTFRLCRPPVLGLQCTLDKDCVRKFYVCSPANVQSKLEMRCQKSKGTALFGEACSKHDDCKSRFCLASGTCSQACTKDIDCPTSGAQNVLCVDLSVTYKGATGKIKGCLLQRSACKRDADCGQDEVCAPYLDDAGSYDLRCIPRFASSGKADGAACQANADCKSDWCDNKICSTCQANADCGTGRLCFQGRCTRAKALGSDCTQHQDCIGRSCVDKKCSQACSELKDCQNSGFACEKQKIVSGKVTLEEKFCVAPQGGLPCASNQDCPSSQEGQCRIIEVNSKMVVRCRAAKGTKKVGESCTADADCISGTCLMPDGICTAVCQKDSDCPGGKEFLCIEREFKSGTGASSSIKVCSNQPCLGSTECPAPQMCIQQVVGGKGFLRCRTPDSSKAKQGASCTQDNDCQSQLCYTATGGKVCAEPCLGGNSSVCPLQFKCEAAATGSHNTHLCVPIAKGCSKNSDCGTGELCTLSMDATGRPTRTCTAAIGTRKVGEVCDPNEVKSSCQTGFCDKRTGRCSSFCTRTSDCPTGEYLCSDAIFKKASGQLGADWKVKACRSTICIYDGNCASNEACNVKIVKGKAVKRCVPATSGKPGDACSVARDCSSGLCRSQRCVAACAAHRNCAANQICTNVQVLPGITSPGCVQGKRTSCSGNADCLPTEVCQAHLTAQGKAVTECKKPLPTDRTVGQPCTPGTFPSQCASGLCDDVKKVCVKVCNPVLQDCKVGVETCRPYPLLTQFVNACLEKPKGCTKASDCPAGTICNVALKQGKLESKCIRPEGKKKKVGDACAPVNGFPGNCATHLCNPELNVCVNTCSVDADCPGSRPKCGKVEVAPNVYARLCTRAHSLCESDKMCPTSEPICAFELLGNKLSKRCSTGGPGTKKIGEKCDPSKNIPGDCVNRFCEEGTRMCTAVCEKDEHCPAGLSCVKTFVEGTRNANGCVRKQGAVCETMYDCAKPMVCAAERRTQGIVSTCKIKPGTGFDTPCEAIEVTPNSGNYKFTPSCKSDICNPKASRCTAPCKTDADCPAGTCSTMQLSGYTTKVCDTGCVSNADCRSGEVCTAGVLRFAALGKHCKKIDPNKGAVGAACNPKLGTLPNCQTGVCSPATSKCSTFCGKDSDCGAQEVCVFSFVRHVLNQAYARTKICVPEKGSCSHQDQCYSGYICGPKQHGSKVILACIPRNGSVVGPGSTCDPAEPFPNKCYTNLCDPKSKKCTSPCRTDADCTSAQTRTKCGTISINGTAIAACIEP